MPSNSSKLLKNVVKLEGKHKKILKPGYSVVFENPLLWNQNLLTRKKSKNPKPNSSKIKKPET